VDTASNQIDAQIGARWQRLAHALGKNLDWLE
jgi:flagellar assembly protein FliH